VKVFAQPLREHLGSFPYRTPEFGKELSALGLDTSDLKIAMQMNGRIPLKDLLAHGRGELGVAYSLIWFLNLTGTVKFSNTPVASSDTQTYAAPEQIAARKRKAMPPETLTELRDAAVKIITGSYFKVLGLDIAADTEAVERAYQQVAAKFHPDSYPEFDTSEIRDLLDSVQDKLAASYRVLSVEDKRKAYLQYLLSRLDVGRSVGINVEAEIALKRGESALKRKDLTSAIKAFEEAVSLNPREPEYYSHLAWATYLGGAGDPKARAKSALKLLKKALGLNPYLERAIVISAIIEGETGDASGARKKLLRVLELNPSSQLAKAALHKVNQ
jgi:tetratricopeptide (TPR) repeat protein